MLDIIITQINTMFIISESKLKPYVALPMSVHGCVVDGMCAMATN